VIIALLLSVTFNNYIFSSRFHIKKAPIFIRQNDHYQQELEEPDMKKEKKISESTEDFVQFYTDI
jgi:hypothetical protein